MEEEKRILMMRVVDMVGDERWGFEEIFPIFTHTSKSNDGFGRKPFENVDDNLDWQKVFVTFTRLHLLARGN